MLGLAEKKGFFAFKGRIKWLYAIALIFLGLLLYAPVINFEFILYDDPDYVTLNPWVLNGLTWEGIKWAFLNIHGEKTYWHPLTWLSHMLDCELFRANPGAHHLINLLFAIANSLLLFHFLEKLTGSVTKSFIVAVLFLIHPVQIETIAWISERKNLLTTFFALLSLIFYLKYVTNSKPKDYAFVFLFFTLCLMSKPALAPLPFLMLLLDFYPLQRIRLKFAKSVENPQIPKLKQVTLKRAIIEKIPLLVLVIGICVVTIEAHKALSALAITLPLQWRIENAIVSISSYLQKIILPMNFAVFYPHPGKWDSALVFRSGFLIFLITILLLFYFKRNKFPLIGWFWFLGMLVPASGIIQAGMQAMAMRFIYFPIAGIFITCVWIADDLLSGFSISAPLKKVLATAVIIICFILNSNQLLVWQNSLSLFEETLKHTKNNFIAHCSYGLALYYRGNYKEAKEHFLDAIRIFPKFIEARMNLGMVLEKENNFEEAYEQYRMVTAQRHDLPFAWKALAKAASQIGRTEEALQATLKAIELNPASDPELYFIAGYLASTLSRAADAVNFYRKSLELNPNQPVVLNNLAWLLATLPDDNLRNGNEAVALAQKANELTGGKNVIINGTLAAAYAEAGNFEKAVEIARKAIELAASINEKQIEQKNRELLKLYLDKKPYREPLNYK